MSTDIKKSFNQWLRPQYDDVKRGVSYIMSHTKAKLPEGHPTIKMVMRLLMELDERLLSNPPSVGHTSGGLELGWDVQGCPWYYAYVYLPQSPRARFTIYSCLEEGCDETCDGDCYGADDGAPCVDGQANGKSRRATFAEVVEFLNTEYLAN